MWSSNDRWQSSITPSTRSFEMNGTPTSNTGMPPDLSSYVTCCLVPVMSASVLVRLNSWSFLMCQPVTASVQADITARIKNWVTWWQCTAEQKTGSVVMHLLNKLELYLCLSNFYHWIEIKARNQKMTSKAVDSYVPDKRQHLQVYTVTNVTNQWWFVSRHGYTHPRLVEMSLSIDALM